MKKFNKLGMYAGVSAAALGLAFIAAPAAAFDEVNWEWNAEINEVITKTIDITADLTPTGMIMLEDLQVSIGDHTATSTVTDVFNNQPVGNGEATGELQFLVDYINSAEYTNLGENGSQIEGDVTLTVVEDGIVFRNGTNTVNFGCSEGGDGSVVTFCQGAGDLEFTIDLSQFDIGDVIALDPLDATTELPEVISTATAVANNTAIQSDASIQLHEGQFAFGGGNGSSVNGDFDDLWVNPGDDVNGDDDDNGWNSNLVAVSTLGSAAILGLLESADITATSTVNNIHNATVDSTATAVANNLTVELEGEGADRLLIGDVVQFSYADTSATSDVSQIYLNNYEGLGLIDRPIVNSVATAVGNNKSITVSVGGIFGENGDDDGNGFVD